MQFLQLNSKIQLSHISQEGDGFECGRFNPEDTMNDPKVSELTVSQLQQLIRETVQEAVAEVIIEFNALAEAEEQIRFEAEMNDYLRSSMQRFPTAEPTNAPKLDD